MRREDGRPGRRRFLQALPAGAAGVPLALAAGRERPTKGSLGVAQELAGLDLGDAERERATGLLARYREHYEALRKVDVPPDTEPAVRFRPLASERAGAAPEPGGRAEPAPRPARPDSAEELAALPATALAGLLRSRKVSSVELTRIYLDRLSRHDTRLHCVVTLTPELALAQAEQADREIRRGAHRGPLHGVPYGIKDLFDTRGLPTTWGAKPFARRVPDHDATVVERLREAGAVLLGKLATGELAIGDRWFGGQTRNPWDPEKGSSGSSAGPAAATAAALTGFAVGTETGGSIVSPASTCGVVGLRPTYGRVSRWGCMSLRWTMDKVGLLGRSVGDCMLALAASAGPDGRDDSVQDVPLAWNGQSSLRGLRLGYVEREFAAPLADASEEEKAAWPERRSVLAEALDVFRAGGAQLRPVALPDFPGDALYAVLSAEAGAMFDDLLRSGALGELADQGPGGRPNQLYASRFIPAVEYLRAQRVRTLLMRAMSQLFRACDVLLTPPDSDSVSLTNLTGHPALVLPAGFVRGLPQGLMLTGRLWDEATLARAGLGFERATPWHTRRPALA